MIFDGFYVAGAGAIVADSDDGGFEAVLLFETVEEMDTAEDA